MANKTYLKNLKDYSVIAYSWNPSFQSISFKPGEIKDCSGIETVNSFSDFINTYINTNILTIIRINDIALPASTSYNDYFYYDYIDDD